MREVEEDSFASRDLVPCSGWILREPVALVEGKCQALEAREMEPMLRA